MHRKKNLIPRVPWIKGLKKPLIDFTIPTIELPYEAPHKYLLGIILCAVIFLLGGGIYNLAETPLPMGQTPEGIIIIFPELSEQFLIESLIASLFIGLGAGGCYLIWFTTRFAYDTRTSLTLLIIGITLTLIAAGGILVMYDHKIKVSRSI
ncbi:MAG: hypothetical protein JSW11_15065 [Candidatus Heimdallarchaeota archaeon]|nr:MAG: hypothetical protein JSW11_15065 [Candidatus Heimdallarchaeota archaeon]